MQTGSLSKRLASVERFSAPACHAEYAKSPRSTCKGCKEKIDKAALRFGSGYQPPDADHISYSWKHWTCVTDKVIANVNDAGGEEALEGLDSLADADQDAVRQALERGSVKGDEGGEEEEEKPAAKKAPKKRAAPKKEKAAGGTQKSKKQKKKKVEEESHTTEPRDAEACRARRALAVGQRLQNGLQSGLSVAATFACLKAQLEPMGDHDIIQRTEAWVRDLLRHHDGSHDWWHIHRVRAQALRLAAAEGVQRPEDLLVVELAALLHDATDHKYTVDAEAEEAALRAFLGSLGLTEAQLQAVQHIIGNLGFSEELARREGGEEEGQGQQQQRETQQRERQVEDGRWEQQHSAAAGGAAGSTAANLPLLLAVVQDADRLDALGAVGIARCFTFGGRFNRALHDPAVPPRQRLSKEAYQDKGAQQTTINHFYEKLLLLKVLMRTRAGRRAAEERHAFMEAFLRQFLAEWEGAA
eukprot:scaffold3.g6715.t1